MIGIGELLWDMLPDGKKLGGAPANFAYHAAGFGHRGIALSRLGNDALGGEALRELEAHGLSGECVQRDSAHATSTVQVTLENGHPSYEIVEGVAWDFLEATPAWLDLASRADVLCFGTLAQRSPASRSAIQSVVASAPASALRILDVNLRQRFYDAALVDASLKLANVFKLNGQELPVIAGLLGIAAGSDEERCRAILRKYGLRMVALTRGERGSLLITPQADQDHPGFPVTVADTVGAGDAFTAGLAHGLMQGLPLQEIAEIANRTGAWVASQSGAMPARMDLVTL
jgi:fructokinase